MKKFLVIILTLIFFLSLLCTNVSAAEQIEWKKFMGASVTKVTENGKTFYSASELTANFSTPGFDILPELKKHANADELNITISFAAKVKLAEDASGDSISIAPIFRAIGLTSEVADYQAFEDMYEGSFFRVINKSNIMAYNFTPNITVTEEWQEYDIELVLYSEDLATDLVSTVYFCFQNYTPLADISELHLKDTSFVIEADGEGGNSNQDAPATTTKAPAAATATASGNNGEQSSDRPTITKSPARTTAPDSSVQTVLSNGQVDNTLAIIAIIISSVALIASVCSIVLTVVFRKKK